MSNCQEDIFVAIIHKTPIAVAMSSASEIEESLIPHLDFQKLTHIAGTGAQVIPTVVQDATTLEVLLIAYVNEEALRLSLLEKRAIFYSTSRAEIWRKGETSGDVLFLEEVRVNCEQNSLLFLVRKSSTGSCHTKDNSGKHRSGCYYRKIARADLLVFVEPKKVN